MTKSIDKGKEYERRIAKFITDWAGLPFIRTPQSGAWQGTSGDIIPKNRERPFNWIIECKKTEQWNMEQLLTPNGMKCAEFRDWQDQLVDEVRQDFEITGIYRIPVLIFSRNHRPDYMCLPVKHTTLTTDYQFKLGGFLHMPWHEQGVEFTIMPFARFLRDNTFEHFEKFTNHYRNTQAFLNYYNTYGI